MKQLRSRKGVTLIELLVVMGIITLLATLALNSVKGLLSDRKVKQAGRLVEQYLESAKVRAITTGRPVAVFLDRVQIQPDAAGDAVPQNYTATRLSMGEVFPPYRGDVVNAKGSLWDIHFDDLGPAPHPRQGDRHADQVRFYPADVFSGLGIPSGEPGFVSEGDLIEFEGVNRRFVIESIDEVPISGGSGAVQWAVSFRNLPAPNWYNSAMAAGGYVPGSAKFLPAAHSTEMPVVPLPSAAHTLVNPDPSLPNYLAPTPLPTLVPHVEVGFRIYRRPTKSMVGAVTLPRGTCIDLFASGLGLRDSASSGSAINALTYIPPSARSAAFGNADSFTPSSFNRIGIAFDPTGKPTVMFADENLDNGAATFNGVAQFEIASKLQLLVGRTDQVNAVLSRPTESDRDAAFSNVLDSGNTWVTLNPQTGLITSSPVAAVNQAMVDAWTAATTDAQRNLIYRNALAEARSMSSRGVRDASNN